MKTTTLAGAAAAGSAFLVGATIVATRAVISETGPGSLALLRYAIGFCCLLIPTLLSERARIQRRDLLPIAALGIVQFAVVVALLNWSLQYIASGRAALIFATTPLLTMAIAALLGLERITVTKAGGVALAVVGVALALGETLLQPGTNAGTLVGYLAAFGSALSAATCSVLYRPYLQKYPVLPVSSFAMLASVFALAVLAAGEGFFRAVPQFSATGWVAVGFIGVSSGVGYYLWLWALRNTTPTNVTVFLTLSPVAATALGALLFAEPVSATFLVGLAFAVVGLVLAHWPGPVIRRHTVSGP